MQWIFVGKKNRRTKEVSSKHSVRCWLHEGVLNDEPELVGSANVKKYFPLKKKLFSKTQEYVKAVDGVSFTVKEGETLSIVGESGCGKSTTGRVLMKLLEATEGQIIFEGQDITHLNDDEIRPYRKEFQMVFQDPYASLNPRLTVQGNY